MDVFSSVGIGPDWVVIALNLDKGFVQCEEFLGLCCEVMGRESVPRLADLGLVLLRELVFMFHLLGSELVAVVCC